MPENPVERAEGAPLSSSVSAEPLVGVHCRFSVEPIALLRREASERILENHEETGALPPELFAPHWEAYLKLESIRAAVAYTARDRANLAGYAVFLLNTHLHYKDTLFAFQDVLWMSPPYRKADILKAFMKYQEEDLAMRGAQYVLRHAKPHRNYGAFLLSQGYHRHEVSYLKELRHGS